MSGSREQVLHYSETIASQRDTAGGPASSHLWTVSSTSGQREATGPQLLAISCPTGRSLAQQDLTPQCQLVSPKHFRRSQVKPHGTLWTTALHSSREVTGGISLRGSIGVWGAGGAVHAGTSVSPPVVTRGSFQMPALSLGGQEEDKSTCAVR